MTDKYDIALVVGTRPNFVKAAPLLNKIEEQNKKVLFIHTGQHFDKNMSKNIFDDFIVLKDLKAKIATGNSVHPKIIFLHLFFIK